MEYITGVVERITFENEENGFCVIKVKVKGFNDLVTIVGNLAAVNIGAILNIRGEWKQDAKYGKQFVVNDYKELLPATITGIEKYLGSGLIKGIGPAYAKRIVAKFKEDTLEILEKNIELLYDVEGFGKKRVEIIKKAWNDQKEIKNVMVFLQGNGVSTSYAIKIYKTYGDKSIEIVKENPYRLADDIWGIGFKTADKIAQKMGYEMNSYERCRSGLVYVLNELSNDGHCFAYREQLVEEANKILEIDIDTINTTIEKAINEKIIILDNDILKNIKIKDTNSNSLERSIKDNILHENIDTYSINNSKELVNFQGVEDSKEVILEKPIYLPTFYYSEIGVAKRIKEIVNSNSLYFSKDIENIIEDVQISNNVIYDEIQKEALRIAAISKFMILTGGPGTGKTTSTLAIISIFQHLGAKVLLASPTGRAAKRLSEATKMEAKTIHRLLEFNPSEGYKRCAENPLECDVLIIDETSMVDIILMYNLLKAVSNETIVVLVGDVDQLPSVGAGNVLKDIISSDLVNVVKLTRIFRQAEGSAIITNAHKINKGNMPNLNTGKSSDFFFVESKEVEKIPEIINGLCKNRLPKYYNVNPVYDIQVLCPMQRGITGAQNINIVLQESLNNSTISVKYGGVKFKLNDKVMQIKNNYEKNVFNGDIGIISKVDEEEKMIRINFDGNEVEYELNQLDEIVLAYATTIHKSQGSEYKIVVAPFTTQHFMMLQRNLLYTAVTRAKKIFVLVGTKKAVAIAIKNDKTIKRNTNLELRLLK